MEIQGGDSAWLEAVFEDIPQPYSAVHNDIDELGFCEAHPARFVLDLSSKSTGSVCAGTATTGFES